MASEARPGQMFDRKSYAYQRAIWNTDPISKSKNPQAEYSSDVIRPLVLGPAYYLHGDSSTILQHTFQTWYELVQQFTHRKLTYQKDKLPAM